MADDHCTLNEKLYVLDLWIKIKLHGRTSKENDLHEIHLSKLNAVLMSPRPKQSCPDILLGLNCVFTKEQEHSNIYSGHVPV